MKPSSDIPPTGPPDSVPENEPDALATPEGDNEDPLSAPLDPSAPTPERPRGNEPHFEQPLRKALD
jgi:hypothetical protein